MSDVVHRLIIMAFVLAVGAVPASSQIVLINEVMASNGETLADEDGDYEDWIELYNPGPSAVNLEGFGLSDDYDDPFQWIFPDVVIEPEGFLLVWASNKDRRVPGEPLHTNFAIARDGEEVLLTTPEGVRADELAPREIPRDISLGRRPDGGDDWFYFQRPTPGQANRPAHLLHYWNFNDTRAFLEPTYTRDGGFLGIEVEPASDVRTGTDQGFSGETARLRDDVGTHLRVNNPLDAVVTLLVPTVGHEAIVLQYESRRSGQGAGLQHVAVSVDGTTFEPFDTVVMYNDDPNVYTFDFSEVDGADDNPLFAVQITFEQGEGGIAGNNRFDNITVDGVPLPETNLPPQLVRVLGSADLIESVPYLIADLTMLFTDLEGDPLTFSAWSTWEDNPRVVEVSLDGTRLDLRPIQHGEAFITVEADDGINAPVQDVFHLRIGY